MSKTFDVNHTRAPIGNYVVRTYNDKYNSMTMIFNLQGQQPTEYFLSEDSLIRIVYVNGAYVGYFIGKTGKVQIPSRNIPYKIDIYTVSDPSVRLPVKKTELNNKVTIRFRGEKTVYADVERYDLYIGEQGGDYETNRLGTINASTGFGEGRLLESSRKLTKAEIREMIPK